MFYMSKPKKEKIKSKHEPVSLLQEAINKKRVELEKICTTQELIATLLVSDELINYYMGRYSSALMEELMRQGNQNSKMADTTLSLSDMKELVSEEEYLQMNECLKIMGIDTSNLHQKIQSLDSDSRFLLKKRNYRNTWVVLPGFVWILDISTKGKIKKVYSAQGFHRGINSNWALGMDIHDFRDTLKASAQMEDYLRINEWIEEIEKHNQRRDLILDYTLLKLTENNPRRAYFFAKDFDRDLSIPVRYGANDNDEFDRSFLYQYLDDGGDPYLEIKTSKTEDETISLCDRIMETTETEGEFQRKEEAEKIKEQQLEYFLGIINAYNDSRYETLTKEQIKQKRIERKLKR